MFDHVLLRYYTGRDRLQKARETGANKIDRKWDGERR